MLTYIIYIFVLIWVAIGVACMTIKAIRSVLQPHASIHFVDVFRPSAALHFDGHLHEYVPRLFTANSALHMYVHADDNARPLIMIMTMAKTITTEQSEAEMLTFKETSLRTMSNIQCIIYSLWLINTR